MWCGGAGRVEGWGADTRVLSDTTVGDGSLTTRSVLTPGFLDSASVITLGGRPSSKRVFLVLPRTVFQYDVFYVVP